MANPPNAKPEASTPSTSSPAPSTPPKDPNVDLKGVAKIKALVKAIPSDTPDDTVMFGAAGIKVTVGDLKAV